MKKLIAVAIAAAFSAGAYAQSTTVTAAEAGATSITTKDTVAKKHHKGKKKAVKPAM